MRFVDGETGDSNRLMKKANAIHPLRDHLGTPAQRLINLAAIQQMTAIAIDQLQKYDLIITGSCSLPHRLVELCTVEEARPNPSLLQRHHLIRHQRDQWTHHDGTRLYRVVSTLLRSAAAVRRRRKHIAGLMILRVGLESMV